MRPIEILLVEDNPGDILLTQKAFERARILNQLSVVRDGESALDYLHQRSPYEDAARPELILLDINLPQVNGQEVLREIKSHPTLRRIPVIMLTSSERERDIANSYDAHANSYITKPPKLDQLAAAMERIDQYWFALVRRAKAEDEV
ncbi:MAG: response regulator [Myxococcota bacterium]